jgi:hypothetical protein
MNVTAIRRGMACWLCWSLCGPALHGQETTREQPKQSEANSVNAAAEEVRKLRTELDAEVKRMQQRLKDAEVTKEALSAELQKLRQALEIVTNEKNTAEVRARYQADAMSAKMRELMERRDESASSKAPFLDPLQLDATRQSLEAAAGRRRPTP